MYHKSLKDRANIFAVAPMMDWTDRHCRFFHRLMSARALLYTEMVVADAVIHGDRERLLGFDEAEHPLAVQLGGNDPVKLAEAARICEALGYDEINLNVGCPSDRVQSGTFGACLMREPELVARCVGAIKGAVDLPVTVKCRIGVDDQVAEKALPELAEKVLRAGCDALWVHARKAWLDGLSPKENRDIPPLDYPLVHALKRNNRERFVGINGGITTLSAVKDHLQHMDGVMLGRAAYQNPSILLAVDAEVYGVQSAPKTRHDLLKPMMDYIERHLGCGGRVHHVTRHMVGLFQGQAGARRYRQILSTEAVKETAGPQVLEQAFRAIDNADDAKISAVA